MPTTTNGDEVALQASDCMPYVRAAGYAPETNLENGVWLFYPLRDGVECFADVSEYDESDDVLGFNAIFQATALPCSGEDVVRRLELEPHFAYASAFGGLIVHTEYEMQHAALTPATFNDRFQGWDRALSALVARIDTLSDKRN